MTGPPVSLGDCKRVHAEAINVPGTAWNGTAAIPPRRVLVVSHAWEASAAPDEQGAQFAAVKAHLEGKKPKKTRKVKKMVKQKVKKTVKKMVKVKKGEKPPAKKPSASSTALVPKHKSGGNPFTVDTEESTGITFEQCVREVVLGKSLMDESGKDKLNRLGRLVSSRDQG